MVKVHLAGDVTFLLLRILPTVFPQFLSPVIRFSIINQTAKYDIVVGKLRNSLQNNVDSFSLRIFEYTAAVVLVFSMSLKYTTQYRSHCVPYCPNTCSTMYVCMCVCVSVLVLVQCNSSRLSYSCWQL